MSYTFLLDAGEESSAESFSGIPASVLSRLSLTAERCSCNGSAMEPCQGSPSGMTCEPSMETHGGEKLILSAGASPARTLAAPEKEPESKEAGAGCGARWPGSFAKYDRDSRLWRIRQLWLFEGLEESLATWPRWGLMLDGECWELPTQERIIKENESGYWPTPSGVRGRGHGVGAISEWGGSSNPFRGTSDRNLRCPGFEEWMMGWPASWTALTPLGMDKFQQWLNSHGRL